MNAQKICDYTDGWRDGQEERLSGRRKRGRKTFLREKSIWGLIRRDLQDKARVFTCSVGTVMILSYT